MSIMPMDNGGPEEIDLGAFFGRAVTIHVNGATLHFDNFGNATIEMGDQFTDLSVKSPSGKVTIHTDEDPSITIKPLTPKP